MTEQFCRQEPSWPMLQLQSWQLFLAVLHYLEQRCVV
jgi:hypothetical protein